MEGEGLEREGVYWAAVVLGAAVTVEVAVATVWAVAATVGEGAMVVARTGVAAN